MSPNDMQKTTLSRRHLLRAAGGLAFGVPLLDALRTRDACAQPGEPPGALTPSGYPKRLLIVFKGNGVYPNRWWPNAGEAPESFTLGADTRPLAPFRDRLLFLDGINLNVVHDRETPGEPHQKGTGALLTGWELNEGTLLGADGTSRAGYGKGPSIDQVIGERIGQGSPIPSLRVGVHSETGNIVSRIINYAGNDQPIQSQQDPAVVFQQVFGTQVLPHAEQRALREKRRSVLDFVSEQYRSLALEVGRLDRQRLEEHATLVRELEERLTTEVIPGESCVLPGPPETISANDQRNMPRLLELQRDLVVRAFACDLTRVATLMVGNGGNQLSFGFFDSHGNDHALGHDEHTDKDGAVAKRAPRHVWYMQQLHDLMAALDAVKEGDGSLLDHTLVLFCSENSNGWHHHTRMPFLLAGSLSGHFKTGRRLKYDDVSHNDLLVSVLNAFGIETASFGNPEFCAGPLSGLTA